MGTDYVFVTQAEFDDLEREARELNETFAPLRSLVAQLEARIADSKPKGGFEFL